MSANARPENPAGPPMVGLNDAAKLLDVSPRTLRRMRKDGRVLAVEVNGVPLFPADELVRACIARERGAIDRRFGGGGKVAYAG